MCENSLRISAYARLTIAIRNILRNCKPVLGERLAFKNSRELLVELLGHERTSENEQQSQGRSLVDRLLSIELPDRDEHLTQEILTA